MKIQTIPQLIMSKARYLAAFTAMVALAATSSTASAQAGGLLKYLSTSSGSGNAVQAKPLQITNLGENYRVVKSANVRTAADTNSRRGGVVKAGGMRGPIGAALAGQSPASNPVQQVAYGCNSCGTSSCGGSCGGGSAYSANNFSYGSGVGGGCGVPCNPYRYVIAEALYMRRTGEERFTLSQNFRLGEFDHELGSRITIGSLPDCVHGCEVSLTGPIDWDMSASLSNAGGGINSLLIPGNPVNAADTSAFFNATFQQQTYNAEYWSVEANKTLVGWDVAKVLFGARYVDYDEDYAFVSQNLAGATGAYQSNVENQMFGLQIGLDLLYPVCQFGYADIRARAGGYLNFADSDVRYANAGTTHVANFDEDEEFAGLFEFGTGLRYQLGPALSVRAGAEMWYLTGVATAPDQLRQVVSPAVGRRIRIDDDIFFYGLTGSAEFKF